MTPFQIASLVLCGPWVFIYTLKTVLLLTRNAGSINMLEATIVFTCLAVLLVAFLGVS